MDDPEIHMLISRKPNSLSFSELGNVLGKYPEAGSEYLFPFRYRFYQLVWNSTACFLSIVCSLLVIMKKPQQKLGKLICLSLLGILFFYSIRTFCDSLGENGILPAVISAALPYLGTFLLAVVYFVISKSLISAFISKRKLVPNFSKLYTFHDFIMSKHIGYSYKLIPLINPSAIQ